jgi:DNA-binding MarR family transcriptional regulator
MTEDLTLADRYLLLLLAREGGAAPMQELTSGKLSLPARTARRACRRLEERDLVERTSADDDDPRHVVVRRVE